jgi:hypothetical protein
MKALTLALLFSLPVAHVTPQKPIPEPSLQTAAHRSNGGRWYLAATGHAIYCYGPVMIVPDSNGDLEKVATFCRDGSAVVPLMESPSIPKPEEPQQREGKSPAQSRPNAPPM